MRNEDPSPVVSTVARLWDQGARAFRSRMPANRAAPALLTLGAVALIGLLVYLGSGSTPAGKYLGGGRQYAPDAIARITHALDLKHFGYQVDDRRISVPADRVDDANDLVGKLDVDPPSIDEIRKEIEKFNPWESPSQAEQRARRAREQMIEATVRSLEGIVEAVVSINRTQSRGLTRPAKTASAFVWLQTEADREVSPRTIQMIQTCVVGYEADVTPDAVTVCDRKGRIYIGPHDPKAAANSRTHAREEDLGETILDELDWIKGVRVTVQLVPAPIAIPAPTPVAAPAPAVVPKPEVPPSPAVGVNHPLAVVEHEPEPVAPPPVAAAPAVPAEPAPNAETGLANVWVRVPRSYYYKKALPNEDPSPENLQSIRLRTETLIRTAVEHVVPPGELGKIQIDLIPDDVVARPPLVAPAVPEARRSYSWWLPAAVGGAVSASLLLATILMLAATRRPRAPHVLVADAERFNDDEDEEAGPGPSERVRALIRGNPEAAASVLHRWIGQGGHAA